MGRTQSPTSCAQRQATAYGCRPIISSIQTANKKAATAVSHGIEIVITYEDSGKCELAINGRPALRQLIADVASGPDVFDTILVYDVSRWGALPGYRRECD